MEYLIDGTKYSFSYKELKGLYDIYSKINDEAFIKELPNIIHFACVVSWLKELAPVLAISDLGIIHQLVHLLTDPEEPTNDLQAIRDQFNQLLKLS